jgi:sec-independent protein translocase protein TatA
VVNVGPLEILVVAIIALIVLGPARLPEVARSLGRGMREFRSALSDAGGRDEDEDEDEDDFDDEIPPPDADEPPATYQKDAESSESSSSSKDLV